jgi:D-alanyl-lipoteichoic acid acyltransferase DltB (MBOAT superfamily)
MNGYLIALNKIDFWVACVVAVALLVPWTRATPRKWILAGLNLGFLAFLLREQALFVAGGLVSVFVLLQLVARPRFALAWAALMGLGVLSLFILHKRPDLTEQLGLTTTLGRALSILGFSYVAMRMVEVLRAVFEKRHPPPDLPSTINYLLPFHMLAMGPIQAYDDFAGQTAPPKMATSREVLAGMERIANGLFKKFVLAYAVQKLFLTDFRSEGFYFFLELQAFYIWLYLDFSAYSDIAVGVGTLIGVPTPENFNRPFLARNLVDFWDRWHISLSQAIRRNLYIPSQVYLTRKTGARRPLLCAIGAVTVAFVFSGAWHGLTIPFVRYGALHGFGVIVVLVYGHFLQKKLGAKKLKVYKANPWIRGLAIVLTFEFVAWSVMTLFLA